MRQALLVLVGLLALLAPLADAHPLRIAGADLPVPEPPRLLPHLAPGGPLTPAQTPLGEVPNLVLPSQRAGPQPTLATASSYGIAFACPDDLLGGQTDPCPIRVVDEDDLLGSATVAINPQNLQYIVFVSLHGSLEEGPTRRSRGDQTHTTFVHTGLPVGLGIPPFGVRASGGWSDQPYNPPPPVRRGYDVVLGEDVHTIIDPAGNLYIASLYALQESSNPNGTWEYAVAAFKFDPELEQLYYEFPNEVFQPRTAGRAIEAVWNRYIEGPEQVVVLWRERDPPLPVPPQDNATANGTAAPAAPAPGPAWITGGLTPTDLFSGYTPLPDSLVAGPCEDTSEPVMDGARMYLVCVAAAGNQPFPGVEAGDLLLVEMDFELNTQRVISKLPMRGDPSLAMDAQGRLAAIALEFQPGPAPNATAQGNATGNGDSTRPTPAGAPGGGAGNATGPSVHAWLTTSRLGAGWSEPKDLGPGLHNATEGLESARITALLYRGATNTVHLVYQEEANATEQERGEPQWRKSFVVTDPLGAVLVDLDLDLSEKGEVFGSGFGRGPPGDGGAYDDLRDSILEVDGREFLLFTDYAVYVFAEIVESDERDDAVAFQEAPPIPEPVPAPQVAGTVVNVGAGATAGAIAALGIRRAMASRTAAGMGRGNR